MVLQQKNVTIKSVVIKLKGEEVKDNKYSDIIHLPHHVSKVRPKMSMKDRAAQFSSFAAVVGHESAVKETARLTDQKKELDETEKSMINDQLNELEFILSNDYQVAVTYFIEDLKKEGGRYVTEKIVVKKFDHYKRQLICRDGKEIPIEDIISIEL